MKDFALLPFPEKWISEPSRTATPEERERRRLEIEEWTKTHQQTFVCDACDLMLFLPREIESDSWENWKREDSQSHKPYTIYPFLVMLAAEIDKRK